VDIVRDVGKPKRFEPPRGPWAEVSGRVLAVHDHRAIGIEDPLGLFVDAAEREADRPRQMVLLVLRWGQDLDELCTLGDEALNLFAVDLTRHGLSSFDTSAQEATT
jgi:hypothetical protein